jgi:ferredoxin-thioredoxin reductase catalytic subunit
MPEASPKSLAELQSQARRMALWYSQHSPYHLNPDPNVWEGIVKAIGRQARTFGFPYCP